MFPPTTPKLCFRIAHAVLLVAFPLVSSVQAADPVSFDFGTGPGQTTLGDAGFTDASAGRLTISNQADSVRFESAANNQSGGITQTFDGLGGGSKTDFSITAQFTLSEFYSITGAGRPGGIVLFANSPSVADLNNTGLTVQIITRNTIGNEDLSITSGLNSFSPVNSNTKWGNAGLTQGDTLELKVDVSFSGEDDMVVHATLTRLNGAGGSRTASVTTSASTFIGGDHFGFGGRLRQGYTTDLDKIVIIPEPGIFAMAAGFAVLGLVSFRRRRS